jgi:CheY-like chemotaxis protein
MASSHSQKPLILLAEDTKAYSNILQTKLIGAGYDVVAVENGAEILPALEKCKPQIILLDLLMPEQDGFETLRLLKSDPKHKHIKVLILTNLSQDEDRERCLALGAEEVFIKSDTALYEIVENVQNYL